MFAINWIIDILNSISDLFYELYLDCYFAGWPIDILAGWFYYLSTLFSNLAWDFFYFSEWVSEVDEKIRYVLSQADIEAYFAEFIQRATDAWNWVINSFWNVWDIVENWWAVTSSTVMGWIDAVYDWTRIWIDYLQDQVSALSVRIDDLLALIPNISDIQNWFANWTGNVTSVITTWWTGALTEVQGLIDSAFVIRDDFWAGWQDWRDKVTEFFTDPEDWLYKSVDRIVERFW